MTMIRAISASVTLVVLFMLAGHAQAQSCPAQKTGKYTVKIDSAPQGATVYIGDKACGPVGNTPWTGKLNKGDVAVTLAGFVDRETVAQAAANALQ